ncbi:hypothetical protein F5B18DRAFT_647497 [Nemania serpens]|nr:hypothetical protein F5B18DRAFT_647497 [Nemania serpens]
MDGHPDQEVTEGGDKSPESSIGMSSTSSVHQTSQKSCPSSPHIPISSQRLSGLSGLPAPSTTLQEFATWSKRRGAQEYQQPEGRQQSEAEQHHSTSAHCTVAAAPSLPSTAEPHRQTSVPFRPQAPIPAAAAATAATASTQQQRQQQQPTPFTYPGTVNPTAPQYPASFPYTSFNPAAPQASFTAVPWPHHPAQYPTRPAQSGIPANAQPNIGFRAPPTMAATNGWSPLAQSLFCPPPHLQQPQWQQQQPQWQQQPQQQQQHWYYYPYPAANPAAGLPVTCTRPSPWWSGTSHYLTNPPPQAPQVYTVEPAYIMPQATYYQAPAPAPMYYYAVGAPTYYYA